MTQTWISVAALAVGALGLLFALSAHRRITAARRALLMLQSNFEGKTLLDAVATYIGEVRRLENDLGELSRRQEHLFALLGNSARNVGLVRYDAFEEMGGRMSFSAALLDDHGNGVVISSINARTESRAYAKAIAGGTSDQLLSKEEEQAIADALGRNAKVRR